MKIVTHLNEWKLFRQQLTGKKIGFVPTMGCLHQGHMSLCQQAQAENDISVVSIFVNSTQFNQASDFDLYPRSLEADIALLSSHHIDYLFVPKSHELYADHYHIRIIETDLSCELEGKFRPGHFTGVLTVVLKLLNLVQATHAYFGEKDYQQFLLVRKMVEALFLPTKIVGCETIRAEDGLALSSRNARLTPQQRALAAHFPRLLNSLSDISTITTELQTLGFKVDYIFEKWQRRLGAVWLGDIRLIDNVAHVIK
ncbi:MAG: pantoate--beta-alanine ligase [Gammaproteobacteria bacterium RIFCSPHIGHO2_12_FULL_37_34]|nr:MAG: pantoate--beta-alanine ligase [Gammaproteobacteria bacterium RIFCSPHIGHO2_12_FULL_37_34]